MLSTKPRLTIAAVAVGLAASGLVGGVAVADDDRDEHSEYEDQDRYGREDDHDDDACSGTSEASVDVERAGPRRLVVDAEIENSTSEERWLLEVWHNGRQRVSTTLVADREGDLELTKSLKDRRGKDVIELKATSESGETCSAASEGFAAASKAPKKSGGKAPGNHTSKPS